MKLKDGLFVGLLIGAGLAFLYAPKSGNEVREEVKGKIDLVPKNFFNLVESLLDLSMSVLDFVKESFKEQSDKISDAVSHGLDVAKDKTADIKSMASSLSRN